MGYTTLNMESPSGSTYSGDLINLEKFKQEYLLGSVELLFIGENDGSNMKKYPAVVSQDLTRSNTVPLHKIDNGFDVEDHSYTNAITFSAKLYLIRALDMVSEFEELAKAKALYAINSSLGSFTNIAIASVNYSEVGLLNMVEATVKFQEVRVAGSEYDDQERSEDTITLSTESATSTITDTTTTTNEEEFTG